jgi:ZIP family zinc transporter
MIPIWLEAGLWGLLAGGALIIGALIGYLWQIPQRAVAAILAFGSGILISALSFELMEEAFERGGFTSTAIGFLAGALIFTLANYLLAQYGAKYRKHSCGAQPSEEEHSGSGLSIAVGSLIDGIPESIVIGLGLLEGGGVGIVAVTAVFLSNIPEGLGSAAGMKKAGRSKTYIFGVWVGIAILSGIASLVGYTVFEGFSIGVVSATTALAAGGILAMLVDTMIPEAFEETHEFAGLITVVGFLVAFMLSKLVA